MVQFMALKIWFVGGEFFQDENGKPNSLCIGKFSLFPNLCRLHDLCVPLDLVAL
jgi:hypothetical protein